jgi:ribosomal-protein-alanine N-acetyltransferase
MFRTDIATEKDIPRILEIEKESISPPWTHGALLSEIYREDSFFAVAVNDPQPDKAARDKAARDEAARDEAIAGFAVLRLMGDGWELLKIAVDKDFRRHGAADMLIAAALGHAAENAPGPVYLEVRKSNAAAIALYEKHGFNSMRQRKDYYTDPIENALIMVREL